MHHFALPEMKKTLGRVFAVLWWAVRVSRLLRKLMVIAYGSDKDRPLACPSLSGSKPCDSAGNEKDPG